MHPHNYVNDVENVTDVVKDLEKENEIVFLFSVKKTFIEESWHYDYHLSAWECYPIRNVITIINIITKVNVVITMKQAVELS